MVTRVIGRGYPARRTWLGMLAVVLAFIACTQASAADYSYDFEQQSQADDWTLNTALPSGQTSYDTWQAGVGYGGSACITAYNEVQGPYQYMQLDAVTFDVDFFEISGKVKSTDSDGWVQLIVNNYVIVRRYGTYNIEGTAVTGTWNANDWNTFTIRCIGGQVSFWANGELLLANDDGSTELLETGNVFKIGIGKADNYGFVDDIEVSTAPPADAAYDFEQQAQSDDWTTLTAIPSGQGSYDTWQTGVGVGGSACMTVYNEVQGPFGYITLNKFGLGAGYTRLSFQVKTTHSDGWLMLRIKNPATQLKIYRRYGRYYIDGISDTNNYNTWNVNDWNDIDIVIVGGKLFMWTNEELAYSGVDVSSLLADEGNVFEFAAGSNDNYMYVDDVAFVTVPAATLNYDFNDASQLDDWLVTTVIPSGMSGYDAWQSTGGFNGTGAMSSYNDPQGPFQYGYLLAKDLDKDYFEVTGRIRATKDDGWVRWRIGGFDVIHRYSAYTLNGTDNYYSKWIESGWNSFTIRCENSQLSMWVNGEQMLGNEDVSELLADAGNLLQFEVGSYDNYMYVDDLLVTSDDQVSTCQTVLNLGQGLIADLNSDCYVEWADFGIFASQWQQCTDPDNPACSPQ